MPFMSSVRGATSALGRGRRRYPPVWSTAEGVLGTTYDHQRTTKTYTVAATLEQGAIGSIVYSLQSGSLPTGQAIGSANGIIHGAASSVGSDANSSFILRATNSVDGSFEDRQFYVTVKALVTEVFTYSGSNQTWNKPSGVTSITMKAWGAAGGGSTAYNQATGGSGGYASGVYDVSSISSLTVVVGGGGVGGPGILGGAYGHPGSTPTGQAAGTGNATGSGGGLSGIFNGPTGQQSSAVLIAAGGGGSGAVQPSNFTPGETAGQGGAGGGAQQAGDPGFPGPSGGQGRGAPTSAGGQSGIAFFVSPNGRAPSSTAIAGGALYGGHADNVTPNWTEGGGGGAGYWGGGSGAHDSPGGWWGTAGGGSGYAAPTVTSVVGYRGTYGSVAPQASSDPNYSPGVAAGVAGGTGGNGRVVITY